MKYRVREFRKDIPNDQEKLMMRIINRMNGYDNEKKKDRNNKKNAASAFMDMMSGKRGKTSNDKEELVCNKLDDDNNCEAAIKQTNNIIEHDISCVADTNKGEKGRH